jgi:hypothetical protein
MKSIYKEGSIISFNGFLGSVIKVTETYRKNVIVMKVNTLPKHNPFPGRAVSAIGIFEYPDGKLEFMSVID